MGTKKRVVVKQDTKADKPEDLTLQKTEKDDEDVIPSKEKTKDQETIKDALDPIKEMEEKLAALEQESKETHGRLLRVSAEFENYKKRMAREMADFRKFATESFARALLPVIDNLDRAIESSSSDEHANSSLVEGVNMTLKEILRVFEQYNVKPFDSFGKVFDPSVHQAMHQEETEEHPDNTVIREFQKGYMIHDRLLRPAMVVVSKKKKDTSQKKESNTQDVNDKAIDI